MPLAADRSPAAPGEGPHSAYGWTRFWCSREGVVRYGEDGFVLDPEGDEWSSAFNPDLRRFAAIEHLQCLALLGEPGIGKTVALEHERVSVEWRAGRQDVVLPFNLRFAESLTALERRLFGHDVFEEWKRSSTHLHLFLDSLDEGLLEVASLGGFLLERLRETDLTRLSLRIASRTADWLPSLEKGLLGLFGEEQMGVFELVQLRRRDVGAAATAEGLDADAFLHALEQRQVVPLAIKPVTLRFLLGEYARTGSFPGSLVDLYRNGCLQLCEEPDPDRRARATRQLAATERLAIAERLAAATVYAGRDTFWTGSAAEAPSATTAISEIAGGREQTSADLVAVPTSFETSEAGIHETLATGLFTARGSSQLGWAHQTYSEFLAARYLVRRFGDRTSLLLSQIGGRDGRIVPQLQSAAGWVAMLDADVRRFLLEHDPEVLLRSDLTLMDEGERTILVDKLLALAAAGRLDSSLRDSLRNLSHPRLADQLRTILADGQRTLEERALAIDIAELSELSELGGELAGIALDHSEPYRLRIDAAYAITQLGTHATRQRLRPLLSEPVSDPQDDLRGAALIALWPEGLSIEDLICALSPPQRHNYFGIYMMFLTRQDFAGVPAADLAVLLGWAAEQPRAARHGAFDDFIDRLIAAGIRRIDELEVGKALAPLMIALLARDHTLAGGARRKEIAQALERPELRRQAVALIVARTVEAQQTAFDLTYSNPPFLREDDVPWLIAKLEAAANEEQPLWAELIGRLFVPHRSAYVDLILEARERNEPLRAALAPLLDAVTLDSERAKLLRESHERSQQLEVEHAAEESRRRPPQVQALLTRFDGGDLDAWWLLSLELVIEAEGEINEFKSDLTASPTWLKASSDLRQRLLAGSLEYLRVADPHTESWFGKDIFHRPAAAGYRALRLLLECAPERLQGLSDELWALWAPIIVAYPAYGGSEGTAQRHLVALAYNHAPEALRRCLVKVIEIEDAKGREPFVLRRFEDVWDDEIEITLAERVADDRLAPRSRAAVLAFMLDHRSHQAEELARLLVPQPPPSQGDARELALGVALLLIARVDRGFELVWPTIESDEDFGRSLIERLAHRGEDERKGVTQLDADQLARMFIWTERRFSHSEDPDLFDDGYVGTRESVGRWRDSLLTQLELRGTDNACRALRRIRDTFPELPWLRQIVARAEVRALAETWVRPTPAQLIALAAAAERRFVANGEQLLDVLSESLVRAQGKLTGETPQASWLWNILPDGSGRPRDESSLSDWLKVHLEADFVDRRIIVNREVEIRRAPRAGLGERTDIHVDAIARDREGSDRHIRAVVEVKGCWNEELATALSTQLVASYLVGANNHFGTYVIGWFDSERWDKSDWRLARCRARSRQSLTESLSREATEALQEHAVLVRIHSLDIPL